LIRIPAAESHIMDALWRRGPLSTEEIVDEVGEVQGWTEGTVRTLINRLLRKKAIAGERKAGRFSYRPLIDRDAYVLTESQGLLDRLFDGEVAPMIAHFARHRALTPKDVEQLKALIRDLDHDRS
jgi:BlaI family transcriptional regulator, penicillinase repressor